MAGRPTSDREVVGSSPIAFKTFFSLDIKSKQQYKSIVLVSVGLKKRKI